MHFSFIPFSVEDDDYQYTQDDLDNHSVNLNPNNDQYYDSRGIDRPDRK